MISEASLKTSPPLSIVVPIYNNLQGVLKIVQWLGLLQMQEQVPLQVVFADDASTEFNLPEILRPPFQVLRNPKNFGFPKNCNEGARLADKLVNQNPEGLILFLNSDVEMLDQPNPYGFNSNFASIIREFEDPKVGIVGPRLLFANGTIQSVGGQYDVGKGPYHRFLGFNEPYGPADESKDVPWITGAVFATRLSLFKDMGGFDEAYGSGYFEDVDYCEKVKQVGYRIRYCAESTFIHSVGNSSRNLDDVTAFKRAKQFRQNSILFHSRYDPIIIPDVGSRLVNY